MDGTIRKRVPAFFEKNGHYNPAYWPHALAQIHFHENIRKCDPRGSARSAEGNEPQRADKKKVLRLQGLHTNGLCCN